MGYYRFLENENVSVGELERSLSVHCTEQVEGKHVLAISDSSEINKRVACRKTQGRKTRSGGKQ